MVEAVKDRKKNNLAEKHCYCGHPIPKGQVQGDHHAYGWAICSSAGGGGGGGGLRDEHVGDIERYIHTVKERMRAVYNTMPFNKVPAHLVIEMAKTVVFWLNAFPIFHGTSVPVPY